MADRLREVLPQFRAAPMPVHLLYPHRRQLPRRVQVFMQWLAALMSPRLMPTSPSGPLIAPGPPTPSNSPNSPIPLSSGGNIGQT
jgi:hypothetical protein